MDPKAITGVVGTHPLLATLDEKVLQAVIAASRLVRFRPKRTFLHEGDPTNNVFCLLKGAVRVFHRSTDGDEILVKLFRAPALFGEMEALANRPSLEFVATLEPSEVLHIPAEVFRKLVNTQRTFTQALVHDLAARLCIATHNERSLAFCDVDTRLANLLLDYAALAGESHGSDTRIGVRITQDSMAHDLAVSRKSLVRALAKLQEQGVVSKRDGRYVIHDLDALKKRSSGTLGLHFRSDQPGLT